MKDLTSAAIWPLLSQAALWPTYYNNASKIGFDGEAGPELSLGARFRAWVDGTEEHALDVLHAWLVEDMPGERVRMLTQESQIGKPPICLAQAKPNPMLNAHQDWLTVWCWPQRSPRRSRWPGLLAAERGVSS